MKSNIIIYTATADANICGHQLVTFFADLQYHTDRQQIGQPLLSVIGKHYIVHLVNIDYMRLSKAYMLPQGSLTHT